MTEEEYQAWLKELVQKLAEEDKDILTALS